MLRPKLSAYWPRFVTTVPTNLARALIQGLEYEFTAHPHALRRLIPQCLAFREAVDATFAAICRRAEAVGPHLPANAGADFAGGSPRPVDRR